ncbi:hypothetical protein [Collimonas silvisoli]|uniref:hypothetical protein n=1 Tax=Collimonas silvisoli TaxID=2825884 RepID=UPI001B8BBEBF|nr:hypothetical protein [Collimonas silvisoli]
MNLLWYTLERQELPQLLMSEITPSLNGRTTPTFGNSGVAIGMNESSRPPIAAVTLVGERKAELFSWLSTYAEHVFPLTQFCRVCSVEDWTDLKLQTYKESTIGTVHPIWSSLVLGEMLGQADAELDVSGVPLARAAACFSFAIARTSLLYPEQTDAEATCIKRMEAVERDSRFTRRHINVGALKKIWSTALTLQEVPHESFNFLDTVIQIVSAVSKKAARLLTSNQYLLSDSAEERVIGFDAVVDTFFGMRNSDAVGREGGAVALAAASLLVGRGTSHIQLLAPATKAFPEVLVWYGLLAGVLGPRSWDKAWMQKTKGIEKALRQFFHPDEPVMADLCWPEYEWLSQTYDSLEVLSTTPKTALRSLAIELLPGVDCQFRLIGQEPNSLINEELILMESPTPVRAPLIADDTIELALDLITQVQQLLQPQRNTRPTQPALFDNESPSKPQRPARRKSGDKSNKDKTLG